MLGFMDLPPEMRNRIYHYAIPSNKVIKITKKNGDRFNQIEPGIIRTCREIRDECLALWEDENVTMDLYCDLWTEESYGELLIAGEADEEESKASEEMEKRAKAMRKVLIRFWRRSRRICGRRSKV